MGYYFILIEYIDGRWGYSLERCKSKQAAEPFAAARRNRPDVKSARVCYQPSEKDVDIKQFI